MSKNQNTKLAESGPSASTTQGIAPTTTAPQPTEGQDEPMADAEGSAANYSLPFKRKAQDEAGPESKKLKPGGLYPQTSVPTFIPKLPPEPPPPALKRYALFSIDFHPFVPNVCPK